MRIAQSPEFPSYSFLRFLLTSEKFKKKPRKLLLKYGVWLVTDEKRPTIVDVHGRVVDHADVARDFGVVEDTAEVNDGVVKLQIGEVNLAAEADVIHVRVLLHGQT